MSWLTIAPGIQINPALPVFAGNPVVQQAQVRQQQQQQTQALAQQQARQQASLAAMMQQQAQKTAATRARGNAALTSLRILGQGPNQSGAQARVSRVDPRKRKKKRTTASLRFGSQGSQGGGGGLNIGV